MDDLDLKRRALEAEKRTEESILKTAKEKGYDACVRSFLRNYLSDNDEKITKQHTEILCVCFGVLSRAGLMTESDIEIIIGHLGVLVDWR